VILINLAKSQKSMGSISSHTILTVEADSEAHASISLALQKEGHEIIEARDAHSALQLAREFRPDVIILNVTLSDMNGLELCGRLRALPFVNHTPILLVSRHQSAHYAAQALDNGADDYLRKPFATRELTARVRALLRRAEASHANGQPRLRLDAESHTVWLDNRAIPLTPTEFALLEHLCTHQDDHHTPHRLLEQVWNYPPGGGDTALVRNHIRNLRRKLEANPRQPEIIVSLHGRGYSVNANIVGLAHHTIRHKD
jgi:two-component system response regulator MtrA